MSEVLTLAVVPLLHKTVNGCLVNFPGLRCETVPHVLLDVVVRGESFASHSLFLGDQKWRNRRERGRDCVEGDLLRVVDNIIIGSLKYLVRQGRAI